VTADDGALGDQHLRDFQDNEKSIPRYLLPRKNFPPVWTLATSRNYRADAPDQLHIEFKQIIGRGTRFTTGKLFHDL